jgi:hypothetical protein
LSVPCIVLLGGTLPILGLIGAYDTRPQIAELRSDAYAWMVRTVAELPAAGESLADFPHFMPARPSLPT